MESSDHESEYQFCLGRSINEMMGSSLPRFAVYTNRPWMEAYCSLDEGELQHRTVSVLAHAEGFGLWMGILSLFHDAFSHRYTFDTDPLVAYASALFRMDLLVLAGGNVKPAIDAALAGYYSGCMALERHMLETWRRVAYVRLHPNDVWRWIPQSAWPDEVKPISDELPAEKGGMPTSIPKTERIGKVIETLGDDSDRMILALVRSGFDGLSDHSHPSFEVRAQRKRGPRMSCYVVTSDQPTANAMRSIAWSGDSSLGPCS
jgi:hypothetical protein